jgi:DNA adenine methylase
VLRVTDALKAPFPWFGGKSRVAPIVWERFGNVPNYVEPFFGSGAVLLGRPHAAGIETVNDKDALLCNAWRAIQYDPESVAKWADWPPNESDLHARHVWLLTVKDELPSRLEGDPDYFDAKIAGWWLYGIACWIGSEFCSGKGPWQIIDGQLLNVGNAGQGVHRQLLHVGNAGQGVHRQSHDLLAYIQALCVRMRKVRVCCGDWSRVCGPSPTFKNGLTGVFLDPPYGSEASRNKTLYRVEDLTIAKDVAGWAMANADNPLLRIAVCGYEGEHGFPASWDYVEWKASGGYGSQGKTYANGGRERIWFSPHCLKPLASQMSMF